MATISTTDTPAPAAPLRFGSRPALIAFGWLNVGLGMIGVVLPIMPTTVFMLIALWAFSKSSPQFHDWLYTHPRFGPVLQAWQLERAIPGYAKALALSMMLISIAWLGSSSAPAAVVLVVSTGLGVLALWIVTRARPSATRKPRQAPPSWRRAL
jgi:uncharacterized protein